MKTDYTPELQNLIQKLFSPSTPQDETAVPMSLNEIHSQVTNILPANWINEADVYACLETLGFNYFNQQVEDETTKQKTFVVKYYLKTIL